jgi:glutamate synthase domain-containing protein 2/glutamate synthase domain-containing protein 1/glutamate synthase domain-containing protein 3
MGRLNQEETAALRRTTAQQGLYSPSFERDACGMGFVAHLKGEKSHTIIRDALTVLAHMSHRGACGCDPETGDGSGILLQIPHELYKERCAVRGFALPEAGRYAVGMLFLPQDAAKQLACKAIIERVLKAESAPFLGFRPVDVNEDVCGWLARESMPDFAQVFVGMTGELDQEAFERKLYVMRRRIENEAAAEGLTAAEGFYICSLSSRTVVYKGLLIPERFSEFYSDLTDPRAKSAIALVHSRFSTNTFPSWPRAHPYRFIVHNGEINTLRGNVNWMRAREHQLASEKFGDSIKTLLPVLAPDGSDSGNFDNALELLLQTGRSLPHAVMMMIPEAWEKHKAMSEPMKAFYEYHACLMEPWDGPASIAFTDGAVVGAVLDRNGLRPSRYYVTKDDFVVMASEVGVLDIAPERVLSKGRLQPGRMLLVDTAQGRIVDDKELKDAMAARKPYAKWLRTNLLRLDQLPVADPSRLPLEWDSKTLLKRQRAHGYTREDVRIVIRPMAINGEESIGSMGNDSPLAVLSDQPQLLFNYFRQTFAQVTNPPIDPLREELVMSLRVTLGAEKNLFEETPEHCHRLMLDKPIVTNEQLQSIKDLDFRDLRAKVLPMMFPIEQRGAGLEKALEQLCADAEAAIGQGFTVLVLSDRGHNDDSAPIPSLLATAAVHHHLIRQGKRTLCGLVIETGEAREVMHFCLLLGYGASAINPYLAFETLHDQVQAGNTQKIDSIKGIENYIKASHKGIRKVMSKMGISTLQSYQGAQIFEAIGLRHAVIDKYFTGTNSRIEGAGLEEIAAEVAVRHHIAHEIPVLMNSELEPGGIYQWRRRGEYHMYNPESVASLQHAVRSANYKLFKTYSSRVNDNSKQLCTIRGLLEFKPQKAIPIEEVEPAAEIVKRFKTGAMSFGSISKEAHENIAIAMNRIGARSNTGEGGEDPERYKRLPNGDSKRSAIKQVASGRFGVTSFYLVNADELQIKMAQGAKPGEGGQLPGHKVDDVIARVRFATPGVGLISPPPHHDIYSIEDLAQLIFDLKNSNEHARISVKLVSEAGVGTVAAGVCKAKADLVLISGDSGGTGASPLTSIKHAGTPWELGLAETQQTLVINDLRRRIRVETDGQLKTGRDVAVAALLGAEEFGFGTAALVSSGCILMRVCHLNTCPVGVATQDPELRKRFKGQPEHVINFMMFIAEELREIMAQLGFRKLEDMVGRVELLEPRAAIDHWKAKGVDLSAVLHKPEVPADWPLHCIEAQDHGIALVLDRQLIERAKLALEQRQRVELEMPIRNIDRTTCALLSAEVSRRFGVEGLPPDTINITFKGSAGQSFGAFMAPGLAVRVEGDANDYVGKGLSGGRIVIVPSSLATFVAEDNIIAGNVVLYGATGGECYLRGRVGERFCVRNSGATAVVEGVGDHGCEYMTKGIAVVLGTTGRNFAAGMSGGIAYVWNQDGKFEGRCNTGMVDVEPLGTDDMVRLKTLLTRHLEYTGSSVAKRLLESWDRSLSKFVRVMPREYKKVLAAEKYDTELGLLATV